MRHWMQSCSVPVIVSVSSVITSAVVSGNSVVTGSGSVVPSPSDVVPSVVGGGNVVASSPVDGEPIDIEVGIDVVVPSEPGGD